VVVPASHTRSIGQRPATLLPWVGGWVIALGFGGALACGSGVASAEVGNSAGAGISAHSSTAGAGVSAKARSGAAASPSPHAARQTPFLPGAPTKRSPTGRLTAETPLARVNRTTQPPRSSATAPPQAGTTAPYSLAAGQSSELDHASAADNPEIQTVVADTEPALATPVLPSSGPKLLRDAALAPSASSSPLFEVAGWLVRQLTQLLVSRVPTARPEQLSQDPGTPVTGTLNGTDPQGNPLTYTLSTEPTSGTVTVNADGTYIYTPGADLAVTGGTDSFTVDVASDIHSLFVTLPSGQVRLNLFGLVHTTVSVPVSVPTAGLGGVSTSIGFTTVNHLALPLKLVAYDTGGIYYEPSGLPPVGTVIHLGDKFVATLPMTSDHLAVKAVFETVPTSADTPVVTYTVIMENSNAQGDRIIAIGCTGAQGCTGVPVMGFAQILTGTSSATLVTTSDVGETVKRLQ
jgi:hypothetical protein